MLKVEVGHRKSYHCKELYQELGQTVVLAVGVPISLADLPQFFIRMSLVVAQLQYLENQRQNPNEDDVEKHECLQVLNNLSDHDDQV